MAELPEEVVENPEDENDVNLVAAIKQKVPIEELRELAMFQHVRSPGNREPLPNVYRNRVCRNAEMLRSAFDWTIFAPVSINDSCKVINATYPHRAFALLNNLDDRVVQYPRISGANAFLDRCYTVTLETGRDYIIICRRGDRWQLRFTQGVDDGPAAIVVLTTNEEMFEYAIPIVDPVVVLVPCGSEIVVALQPRDETVWATLQNTNFERAANEEPLHAFMIEGKANYNCHLVNPLWLGCVVQYWPAFQENFISSIYFTRE